MALRDSSVLWSLVVDLGLLALFTLQHSLLAWPPVKQALQSVLGVLNRTAYCFSTALVLQVHVELNFVGDNHMLCTATYCFSVLLPLLDLDALLAAGDWCPLSVVSASCALEYLVPSAVLHAALPLLGHHLQHPHGL